MSSTSSDPRLPNVIAPPFTFEMASAKVRAAEDVWNSRDADRVAEGFREGRLEGGLQRRPAASARRALDGPAGVARPAIPQREPQSAV